MHDACAIQLGLILSDCLTHAHKQCRAYADSKTLSEDKRDALLKAIQADTQLAYLIDTVSAADISVNMLSR